MPDWVNPAGEAVRGKTITLDVKALKATPDAMEIMRLIVGP